MLGRCGVDRIPQTGSITGNEGGDEKLDCTIRKSVSESHVNGIVDYSFWFVITHWLYQLYFENIIFLQSEWEWIELRLRNLIVWGSDQEHGWFLFKEDDWVFIDWTADKEKNAAVQILWWWSLECGISLTEKMMSLAPTDQLKAFLSMVRHSQSLLEQSFLALDDIQLSYSRHAHILVRV